MKIVEVLWAKAVIKSEGDRKGEKGAEEERRRKC